MIGTEEAWALPELPKTLAVLGAGASGSEIASAYGAARHRRAAVRGARPRAPDRGRRHLQGRRRARFAKQNIKVHTGTLVKDVESHDDKVTFTYGDETGEAECLVIAAGRGPDVEALGLEAAGVKLDDRGLIEVDGALRTSRQGRLRDRRPRARPGARAQGLRRGRDRRRGRRRPGDAPDRVHRHPARDVLHAQRRLLRADRGAGARAGHGRRRRQGPVRRGRRRHRLRRPRRRDQDHRRQEVRRAASAATSSAPRRPS